MAKTISHEALDAALRYIADRADTLVLCTGSPATVEEAVTPVSDGGRALGLAALVPGFGNGDFEIAPGQRSGRRLIFNGRDGVAAVASGRADHLALVACASDEVLVIAALAEPCDLAVGSSVAVCGFSDEIADPD